MGLKRGICILDLIGLPPNALDLIPSDIAEQLEKIAVLDYTAATSDDAHIYRGSVQCLADMGLPALRSWPVEAPLLNAGAPFQLIRRRAQTPPNVPANLTQNIEPAPIGFQIDFALDRIAITIPGLRPAQKVTAAGLAESYLLPDTTKKSVRIVGGGTLRIASAPGGGAPVVSFVAPSDPIDPDAATGALFGLSFEPPHFFVGGSDVGLTIDRLAYDDSVVFTPEEIVARGHDATWRGISIREATVYMPRNAPWIGDLNVGVRDVLLGSPFGMQGEIRVEFGMSTADAHTVTFVERIASSPLPVDSNLGAPAFGPDGTGVVKFTPTSGATALLKAQAPAPFVWALPGSLSTIQQATTDYFPVKAGDLLTLNPVAKDGNGQDVIGPPVAITFQEQTQTPPPVIDLSIPPITFDNQAKLANVVYLSGRSDQLNGIKFTATPDSPDLRWQLGLGAVAATKWGAGEFQPQFPPVLGRHDLVLTDGAGHVRRVVVEHIAEGSLVIGAESGVYVLTGNSLATKVSVRTLESTFQQDTFFKTGTFVPASDSAKVSNGTVTVPPHDVASVTLELGAADDPDGPPPATGTTKAVTHVQVLMHFNEDKELGWGPLGLPGACNATTLRDWAKNFPTNDFVVIGRTCDIGTDQRNTELSRERATRGLALLTKPSPTDPSPPPLIDVARVHARGEAWGWPDAAGQAAQANIIGFTQAEGAIGPCALIKQENPGLPNDNNKEGHSRPEYRRIDIHVSGPIVQSPSTPTQPNNSALQKPELRRALVPGPESNTPMLPVPNSSTRPYRVQLSVQWDSPTVANLSDAIPTRAEVLVSWQKAPLDLPSVAPGIQAPVTPTGPETFTIVGRWTYDPRSTATEFMLSFADEGTPNGIFSIDQATVAVAFLLGPALISGIGKSSITGAGVRLGALLGACVLASKFATSGKVAFHKIQIEEKQKALNTLKGSRQRILFDYTADVAFTINASVITIAASKPLKVKYKNAGIEIDNQKTGLDRFNIVYENASFDIVDPGQWNISGPLGDLLRVVGTKAGSGSTWYEFTLAFAIDLGVIKITGATLRVTFPTGTSDLAIELRGLAVELNIPNVLAGKGSVAVGSQGSLAADISVKVIPANVTARAALSISKPKAEIEMSLILPVGIPLGSSGLGIFGFVGRFVANGQRAVAQNPDPVQREIDWYYKEPPKYDAKQGEWALGLGAVIGTLPDTGFTFNAVGMVTVAFPDPEVIVSLDAKMLSKALGPTEKGNKNQGQAFSLLGIIVVSPDALVLGIRGSYSIPKLLDLKVPISGYFPFTGKGEYYLRIGSDGKGGRTGDPVTIVVLPGILDVKAWAYFMIEQKSLLLLGGKPKLNFNGFSIGFGAGWHIDWHAGPISLTASAELNLGLGTKPWLVAGQVDVAGKLSLIVISISAHGSVYALVQEDGYELDAEFCGKVDLLLFSIEGCVTIHAGNLVEKVPPPDHPLLKVDLTDRRGAITGGALKPGDQSELPNVVWPDTTPVLQFSHAAQNHLSGGAFNPGPILPGDPWSGATELKYAYRLTSLKLFKGGVEQPGPFDSVWWWPTHTGGVIDPGGVAPSEHEARSLALLSWHPAPWVRNLSNGGQGGPADPAKTLAHVCDPPMVPPRNCALGWNATKFGPGAVKLRPNAALGAPVFCYFTVGGTETGGGKPYSTYQAIVNATGGNVVPGSIQAFPVNVTIPQENFVVHGGYEIPYVAKQIHFLHTLQFDGVLAGAVTQPALTLAIWDKGDRPSEGTARCDTFSDLRPGTRLQNPFVHNAYKYEILTSPTSAPAPISTPAGVALWVAAAGMRITLPAVSAQVSIDTIQFGHAPMTVWAYDAASNPVGFATGSDTANVVQTLTVSAKGITTVVVSGGQTSSGSPGGAVLKVCCATTSFKAGSSTYPQVEGTLSNTTALLQWPGVVVATIAMPGGTLKLVRYTPSSQAGLSWRSFRVEPWDGGHVYVMGMGGVSWPVDGIHKQNEAAKDGNKNNLSDPNAANDPKPEKRALLDSDTDYQIEVKVQWRGWRKPKPDAPKPNDPEPPDLDNTGWTDFAPVTYSFHTAPAGDPGPDPPPADFLAESTFDARGVARYVKGFDPDGTGAPHFLDDPVKAHFSVDYLEQLLAVYQRGLVFKMRRTDPPAGSLSQIALPVDLEFLSPPDIPLQIEWKDPAVKDVADGYFDASLQLAPCINPKVTTGGAMAEITVTFEPDADYDLMLVAPPLADLKSDDVLIARAHFHTSRYRKPTEMLLALGFRTTGPSAMLPHDALLSQDVSQKPWPPPPAKLANDQDFEQTFVALGLDPWPLPAAPRTTVIWRWSGTVCQLAAVMLESDESLIRAGRMNLAALSISGNQTFTLARSNAAATRVLFTLAAPVVPVEGDYLQLEIQDGASTVAGQRYLMPVPRLIYQEVL